VVLLAAGPVPALGQTPTEPGYFFLSAHYTGKNRRRPKSDDGKLQFLPEYYATVLHGPFKTRLEARRALRVQKRGRGGKDKYFTRIYKL
jgi:hypothetical protein